MIRKLYAIAFSTVLPVLLPAVAMADNKGLPREAELVDGDLSETIVVTARKREEDIQQVPISITSFDTGELVGRNVSDTLDLDQYVPNLEFRRSNGSDNSNEASILIRGLGQNDPVMYLEPGVGLYVDGVYLRAQGAVLDLLDLDRVEVLRGPQGTLFGRNTLGGAINVVTRRAPDTFAGRVTAGLGSYDFRDLRATAGGRLAEGLHASLSLLATERDGYSRSLVTGQRFDDADRDAGRLSLDAAPAPSLSLRFTADATRDRSAGSNNVAVAIFPDVPLVEFYNDALGAAGLPLYDERWLSDDPRIHSSGVPSFFRGDNWGTTLHLAWTGRDVQVQSITAYRGFDYDGNNDIDGSPIAVIERDLFSQARDQTSQEVHVSGSTERMTWQIGAFYARELPRDQSQATAFGGLFAALEAAPGPVVAPPGVPDALCQPETAPTGMVCFGGAGNPLNTLFASSSLLTGYDVENDNWALFTEETWHLAGSLSLTAGLRYSRESKHMDFYDISGNEDPVIVSGDGTWDAWTPRVSLSWQVTGDHMLYAGASRGFKSGGLNGRPQGDHIEPFDPEHVWAYEVGLKSTWLDDRLRLNTAAFYSDYDSIQFQVGEEGQLNFLTKNAGDGHISGFEIEAEAQPVSGLVLTAGVGHLSTRLDQIAGGVPADFVGHRLPAAPSWSYNLGAQYARQAGRGFMIARADWSYRSFTFSNIENTPALVQRAHGKVNARLSWTPPSDRWEIALYGTNLTGETVIENGAMVRVFGVDVATLSRPREWGATFQVRF